MVVNAVLCEQTLEHGAEQTGGGEQETACWRLVWCWSAAVFCIWCRCRSTRLWTRRTSNWRNFCPRWSLQGPHYHDNHSRLTPFPGQPRQAGTRRTNHCGFSEGEMKWWKWHQLDHMPVICTSLQTDNHTSTSAQVFYGPDSLPAAQSTASKHWSRHTAWKIDFHLWAWPVVLGELRSWPIHMQWIRSKVSWFTG